MKTMIMSKVLYLAIDDCPEVRSKKERQVKGTQSACLYM